jgi:hypothetical protein
MDEPMVDRAVQDVRTKIDEETHAVMFAVSQIENVDLTELHRRWLRERAAQEMCRAKRIISITRKDLKGSSGNSGSSGG